MILVKNMISLKKCIQNINSNIFIDFYIEFASDPYTESFSEISSNDSTTT